MDTNPNNLWQPPAPAGYQSTAGVLMDAALHRRLCIVRHFDGRVRVIEPYRIFRAKSGRRLLTCFQVGGYTRGTGREGWKNLYLEDLYAACPLETGFEDRTELNDRADRVNERIAAHERDAVRQMDLYTQAA